MKLPSILPLFALLLGACGDPPDVCPASTAIDVEFELTQLEACSGHADFAVQVAADDGESLYLDSDPSICAAEGVAVDTITQCGPWSCDCTVVKTVTMTCPHGDCFEYATLEATCASDGSTCIGQAVVY
jgi:hypothetical protein